MSNKYLGLTDRYDSYSLWDHTENHLTRPRLSTPQSKNHRPSEASVVYTDENGDRVTAGGCLRQGFMRIKGYPSLPANSRSELIFAMGHAVESIVVEQWKQMGLWVDNNVKFTTDRLGFPLKGELDAILREPPDGRLYGIECKSFSGYFGTTEIMGNKKRPGAPKINQLLQTLVYTYIFKEELYCFRMVYMARDEPENHRTFKIELANEGDLHYPVIDGEINRAFTVEDIFNRYRLLQEYLDRDELPPRDYEDVYPDSKVEYLTSLGKVSKTARDDHFKGKKPCGDWQCRYCDMRHHCLNSGNV